MTPCTVKRKNGLALNDAQKVTNYTQGHKNEITCDKVSKKSFSVRGPDAVSGIAGAESVTTNRLQLYV